MDTVPTESLLDETDFLAELATLEDGMTLTPRRYEAPSELLAAVRTRPPGKFVETRDTPDSIDPADDVPSVMQQIAAAGMFVLMMAVGAAGAAALFHDRLARILAAW